MMGLLRYSLDVVCFYREDEI